MTKPVAAVAAMANGGAHRGNQPRSTPLATSITGRRGSQARRPCRRLLQAANTRRCNLKQYAQRYEALEHGRTSDSGTCVRRDNSVTDQLATLRKANTLQSREPPNLATVEKIL